MAMASGNFLRTGGGGRPSVPVGQIRKEFPETWLWVSAIAKYVNQNAALFFRECVHFLLFPCSWWWCFLCLYSIIHVSTATLKEIISQTD